MKESELEEFFTKGSGPGGQHRNKTESCVVIRHIPTGIEARADMRSQFRSREVARATVEARVAQFYNNKNAASLSSLRRDQAGSGQRGDKIKTYRMQDGIVTNHLTGFKHKLNDVLNGNI